MLDEEELRCVCSSIARGVIVQDGDAIWAEKCTCRTREGEEINYHFVKLK